MSEVASQILDKAEPVQPPPVEQKDSAPEVAPQAQTTHTNKDEKVSSRLELLMKRERVAVERERIAKQKEAEIEAQLSRIKEFESAKANPEKALELLGLNYDELTKVKLNDGQIPPEVEIRKLRDEWEKERQSREEEKRQQLEETQKRRQSQEDSAIKSFKTEIGRYLGDNTARYELINFEGQQELVYEIIDEHYNRTLDPETGVGKVMSISEAADKVEAHLEEKYDKSKGLNKIKTLWGSLPKEVQKQIAKPETRTSQPPKTLTNQLSATPSNKAKVLTDEERVQRAIAYARALRP